MLVSGSPPMLVDVARKSAGQRADAPIKIKHSNYLLTIELLAPIIITHNRSVFNYMNGASREALGEDGSTGGFGKSEGSKNIR